MRRPESESSEPAPPDPSIDARTAVQSAVREKTAPVRKRLPIRTCVGCREESPKRDLVRIVRGEDGAVSLDATGRKNGRGAYLHPILDCLRTAMKRKALERALGSSPSPDQLAALEAAIENLDRSGRLPETAVEPSSGK